MSINNWEQAQTALSKTAVISAAILAAWQLLKNIPRFLGYADNQKFDQLESRLGDKLDSLAQTLETMDKRLTIMEVRLGDVNGESIRDALLEIKARCGRCPDHRK